MFLLMWYFFLLLLPTSLATLVNVTIDDTFGDLETGSQITYLPKGAWNVGQSCTDCTAHPEPSRAHLGSWHDGTFNRAPGSNNSPNEVLSTIVPFYGSAVYIYCILSNSARSPDGHSNMTFLLDHHPAGTFTHTPSGDQTFDYDVLVFTNTTLSHGNHTLTIQNGHTDGHKSLVLLDYIIYSYEDDKTPPEYASIQSNASVSMPTPTSTSTSTSMLNKVSHSADPSGKIIGSVLGSIAAVLLLLVVFLFRRQQKLLAPPGLPISNNTPHTPALWPIVRRWFRRWPFSGAGASRFSFNPSLLVGPIVNRSRSRVGQASPATRSKHNATRQRDALRPLRHNTPTTPPPPTAVQRPLSLPNSHVDRLEPLSILEWQRRTQLEADTVPPRFDVLERDLSSYYDDSTDSYQSPSSPPRPPHRPTPLRRFTVMNN